MILQKTKYWAVGFSADEVRTTISGKNTHIWRVGNKFDKMKVVDRIWVREIWDAVADPAVDPKFAWKFERDSGELVPVETWEYERGLTPVVVDYKADNLTRIMDLPYPPKSKRKYRSFRRWRPS